MTRTKTQYHISKDGEVRECKAKGVCPLGGKHFSSEREARVYVRNNSEKTYGILPEVKTNTNSSDTEMKRYVFADGTEIRGVIVGTEDDNKVIVDETGSKTPLRDLPLIEKEAPVGEVDPKVREILEEIKASSNKQEKKEREIQAQIQSLKNELNQRKRDNDGDIANKEADLVKTYKEISGGLFPKNEFDTNVSNKAENFLLNRFSVKSDIPANEKPKVLISENKVEITVPIDAIYNPDDGDWDFYEDPLWKTIESDGNDMTDEIKKYESMDSFNLDEIKERTNNPSFARSGEVVCKTTLIDDILIERKESSLAERGKASLDLVVKLEYDDNIEYSQDNMDNIVNEIKYIFGDKTH